MGRPCLTPPITQKAVTPMNLCSCHRRADACPLPLSEELTTRASFFLLVTKRLHVGLSATWLMISGKKKGCFFFASKEAPTHHMAQFNSNNTTYRTINFYN